MRDIRRPQLDLFVQYPEHKLGQELHQISLILDRHPEFVEWVHVDLVQDKSNTGDNGMSSEQVLRAAILKQTRGMSYEELAFDLEDSASTRAFIGLGYNEKYSSSCLHSNIRAISEQSWEEIQLALVAESRETGLESGKRVRMDSTVVESHIHHPTDASLVYDVLRVLSREFKAVREAANKPHWRLPVPIKDIKSLLFRINNSPNDEQRLPQYKKLLKIASKVMKNLLELIPKLEKAESVSADQRTRMQELSEYLEKIIYQADQRVIRGKKVPVSKKLVSIFEPHTDIIVKDRKETTFGHKIFLTSGESNLILDCQIPRGNPNDSDMFSSCLERTRGALGRIPLQTSCDGGFASRDNVTKAKSQGVNDVCFGKLCGMKLLDTVKSSWVYEKLRNWRAGIEGVISFLKRGFGLSRCSWSGYDGFCRYVRGAVVAFNLMVIARAELK